MQARGKHLLCLPAIALVALALTAGTAAAKNWLDPSFGTGGRAVFPEFTNTPSVLRAPVHLAGLPNGSVLIADETRVVRVLASGHVDRSFGEGGGLIPHDPAGAKAFRLTDLAVDSEGRPLVFGTATDTDAGIVIPAYSPTFAAPSAAEVIRYTSAGSLDISFGGGDGVMRTTFGFEPVVKEGPVTAGASLGAIDPLGRPVLIGTDGEFRGCGHSFLTEVQKLIARVDPNGGVDGSFGEAGQVSLNGVDPSVGLAFDRRDRTLLAGTLAGNECKESPRSALRRLNTNGTLDRTFGVGGDLRLGYRYPTQIVVDRAGRILVLSYVQPGKVQVLRLNSDSSKDQTFGHHGVATISLPRDSGLTSMALDSHGGIVLADAERSQKADRSAASLPPVVPDRAALLFGEARLEFRPAGMGPHPLWPRNLTRSPKKPSSTLTIGSS